MKENEACYKEEKERKDRGTPLETYLYSKPPTYSRDKNSTV